MMESVTGRKLASLALWAVLALAAATAGGCATTAGTEASGKRTWNEEGAPVLDTRVVINNPRFGRHIEVVDISSAMAGDLLRGQVSLRSKDRDTLPIQYRFAWFDAQGMEIGAGAGAWKPFIVYGRESRTIQGVAPDPRAREFKINIRETDKE